MRADLHLKKKKEVKKKAQMGYDLSNLLPKSSHMRGEKPQPPPNQIDTNSVVI